MRGYRSLIAVALISVLAIVTMTGCGGSSDATNKLIGTWILSLVTGTHQTHGTMTWTTDDGIAGTLTFTDTTVTGSTQIDEGPEPVNATYVRSGDQLTVTEDGEVDLMTYTVKGNQLMLSFQEEEDDGTVSDVVLTLDKI